MKKGNRLGIDHLPSWNDSEANGGTGTGAKEAIVDFIQQVDAAGIPAAERIAVFDNDGTLWTEKPLYFQLYFAIDQVRATAMPGCPARLTCW